jgi:hypothetical protein
MTSNTDCDSTTTVSGMGRLDPAMEIVPRNPLETLAILVHFIRIHFWSMTIVNSVS